MSGAIRRRFGGEGAAVACCVLTCAARARIEHDEPPVEYTILLDQPQTQMVDITVVFRGVREGLFDVALPAWRPGRYVILDPAGAIRQVAARTGAGRALQIGKIDKNTWRVEGAGTGGDDEVVVTYRLYANDLGNRTRHVDDSHAFLSPSAALVYAPNMRDKPLSVRVVAPEGWDTATGLDPDPADPAVLVAPNYDVLVDSPLEIGKHERLKFDVEGIPHELVIWNQSGQPRTLPSERIAGDIARLAKAERDIFGDFPESRYIFLVHAYPGGGGGTEHLNSTVMQTSPASFRDEDAFKRFLGLVSHEYFHTWNVKHLRPAGLKPYDYGRENYTDLLWIAEGTTSYLDGVCMVRAGLSTPDEELKRLSGGIDGLRRRPGAAVQSLHDSSFDAWIEKANPGSVNSSVSFYDKGSMLSFLLDMELRSRSDGKASLDTVMRHLSHRFPLNGPGYTTADVIASCEGAGGGGFAEFFAKYVNGTEPLDFEHVVGAVGLELKLEPEKKDTKDKGEKAEAASPPVPSPPKDLAYLGFTLESRDGLAAVSTVLSDGPAYEAGLLPGDLVVAMGGVRLRPGDLDARIKELNPGDEVRLTILRYDHLRETIFKTASRPDGKWTLRRIKEPTDAQRAAYESWLGQKWPSANSSPAGPKEASP